MTHRSVFRRLHRFDFLEGTQRAVKFNVANWTLFEQRAASRIYLDRDQDIEQWMGHYLSTLLATGWSIGQGSPFPFKSGE